MYPILALGRIGRRFSKSACQVMRYKSTITEANTRGPGIEKIALGIGLGAAVAGTVLYATQKPGIEKGLTNNISHIKTVNQEHTTNTANEETVGNPGTSSSNSKTLGENNAEGAEQDPENQSTGSEETANLQPSTDLAELDDPELIIELQRLYHTFEMSYFAAMSSYSLAAQTVRDLKSDIDKYSQEPNESGIASAARDAAVLQLLEKNKEGQKLVTDAEKAALHARTRITALKRAASLVVSEKPILNQTVQDIEFKITEAEAELKYAEDFLKQALLNNGPPEILQKRVTQVVSDLEEELGFSFHGSGNNEQRDLFLKALAWQLLQYRNEIDIAVDLQEKRTRHLLAAKGEIGTEKRLLALLADKEEDLKQSIQKENYTKINELKKKLELASRDALLLKLNQLHKEKETILREERAAFDRDFTEQLQKAQDHNNQTQQEFIYSLNDVLIPNLRAIQAQIKSSADALTLATASHMLIDVLKTDPFPLLDWNHQIQPISHLISTMHDSSTEVTDEFIHTVTSTIPDKALSRGVYTLTALKKRFHQVEKIARKVSLLKDREGHSTIMYILSYLRSLLVIRPVSTVSAFELENNPVNMEELHNDNLLDRAKIFMEQGDLRQAVSYMNMLQGVAQFVSSGWCEEVYIYLEVMQAAQALKTFSTLLAHHTIEEQQKKYS